MSILKKAICGLVVFCSLMMFLGWQLALLAVDAPRMGKKMLTFLAPTEAEGERVIALAAGGITGYLRGEQNEINADDGVTPLFNQREMTHLADVRSLVRAGLALRWVLIALLLFGAFCYGLRRRGLLRIDGRRVAAGASLGVFSFFGLALFAALWVIVDFDSAFSAFHRLLFTNDLWLLDPNEDLMIRLMPAELFASYATDLAVRVAPLYVSALTAAILVTSTSRQKEEAN